MAMNLREALYTLGIYVEYYRKRPSYAELKQMRRNDLIKYHPDKGGNSDKFVEVSIAWDRVMLHAVQEEIRKANQCEECGGTGLVEKKTSFGMTNAKCKKCKGTGLKCKKKA